MRELMMAASGALLLVSSGCCSQCVFRATRDFSHSDAWEGYQRVVVDSFNGSVKIRVVDGHEVRVSGTRRAGGTTLAEAEDNLERVTVHCGPKDGSPDTYLIEVRRPPLLGGRCLGADVCVEVPEACSAEVRSSNGAIGVSDLAGPVVLDTSNGAIEAVGIDGDLRVDTSNGHIEARSIAGRCSLETSNGRVEAEDVRGDLEVHTSNGEIRVRVAPPAGGRVDLVTSNGPVYLELPAGQGADLDLRTSNGRISTELGEESLQNLKLGRSSLRASMNGGGPMVRAATSNGSIRLRVR